MDIHWSYQNLLFWTGIVLHRLSANQTVRCFKLFSYYFGLRWKILMASQFAGFFTFDLFDFLILIPGVHCCIVFIFNKCFLVEKSFHSWMCQYLSFLNIFPVGFIYLVEKCRVTQHYLYRDLSSLIFLNTLKLDSHLPK